MDLDRKASQDWVKKHSRGHLCSPLATLAKEKMIQLGDKDKESQVGDGNNAKSNSNKISNKGAQGNCRKQMKKPRLAPQSSLQRLLTSAELSAATWRGREPPRPEGGSPETLGRVQPQLVIT